MKGPLLGQLTLSDRDYGLRSTEINALDASRDVVTRQRVLNMSTVTSIARSIQGPLVLWSWTKRTRLEI